ncbi:MAG: hypothetical protein ABIP78_11695 [Pyrinomonadaceae bacterium]
MKRLAVAGILSIGLGVSFAPCIAAQVTPLTSRDYFNRVENMDAVVLQKSHWIFST